MTPRQRLLNTAAESYSMGEDEYIKDSEALRELDNLMEEVVKFLSDDTPWDEVALLVDKWLGRAAQAGYREK